MGLTVKQLEWSRKYYSKPEVKEKRKLWLASPEVKEKVRASKKKWRDDNLSKIENTRLIREYGISIQEYDTIFHNQNGKCALCNSHQLDLKDKLCVDHCHTTGIVRGLLCKNCNLALGLFKDNRDTLKRAMEYVKDYKWN